MKISPIVNMRYWFIILIASMCGTNLGDLLLEYWGITTLKCLAIWSASFLIILAVDRVSPQPHELLYWLAILVVRAAATNIADFSTVSAKFGFLAMAFLLAILLAVLIGTHILSKAKASRDDRPPVNGFYWLTMLTAGALGTVIGDGISFQMFTSMTVGIPVSTAMATLALAAVLSGRARWTIAPAATFWIAIVVVRWWGTNTGDALAIILSLPVSILITGGALLLSIFLWPDPDMRRAAPRIP